MPYVIGRPSKRVLALAATTLGLLVTAQPALADGTGWGPQVPVAAAQPAAPTTSCPAVPATQLLTSLGDSAYYAPLPGATYDGSTTGWTMNNSASVIGGGDPWNVSSSPNPSSLSLSSGGFAASGSFCLDSTFPTFRFFAQSSGSSGNLYVAVHWTDSSGHQGLVPVNTLSAGNYTSWTLSPSYALGSALASGQTVSAQIVFYAYGQASWNVDEVLLDPYAK